MAAYSVTGATGTKTLTLATEDTVTFGKHFPWLVVTNLHATNDLSVAFDLTITAAGQVETVTIAPGATRCLEVAGNLAEKTLHVLGNANPYCAFGTERAEF